MVKFRKKSQKNNENLPISCDFDKVIDYNRASLEVSDARQRDLEKTIIRLPPRLMERLSLAIGDVVQIVGAKITAAIAWPAYPQDQEAPIARVNRRIMNNAGVQVGQMIQISRVEQIDAARVVFITESQISHDERFDSFVRRVLLNMPVIMGDKVYIRLNITNGLKLTVQATDPAGSIVIIRENSSIAVSKNS